MGYEAEGFQEVGLSFIRSSCYLLHTEGRREESLIHIFISILVSSLWDLIADSLPPQDADDLAEELGVEQDTSEHSDVEKGPLCNPTKRR